MPHENRSKRSTPPTPEQVSQARIDASLTQADAAALLYTSPRNWQQWETDPSNATARPMSAASWQLFQAKVRLQKLSITLGAFVGRTDEDPDRARKIADARDRALTDIYKILAMPLPPKG